MKRRHNRSAEGALLRAWRTTAISAFDGQPLLPAALTKLRKSFLEICPVQDTKPEPFQAKHGNKGSRKDSWTGHLQPAARPERVAAAGVVRQPGIGAAQRSGTRSHVDGQELERRRAPRASGESRGGQDEEGGEDGGNAGGSGEAETGEDPASPKGSVEDDAGTA